MILSPLFLSFNILGTACHLENGCPAFLQADYLKRIDEVKEDKDFQFFLSDALEDKNTVLENKEFQELVSELHEKSTNSLSIRQNTEKTNLVGSQVSRSDGRLYIFVSFSLGEKALLNLAHEAKKYGAILVLRGFKEGSYKRTVQALQKIILETGQGIIIDPELFTLFSVSSVPTFILTKPFSPNTFERTATPLHDRMQGHVTLKYALETFAKEGDLQTEATDFLEKGMVK
jgi:type-F conjugative transfer system pilin assembly protein TrbC